MDNQDMLEEDLLDEREIQALIDSGFYNQELWNHCERLKVMSLENACLKTVVDHFPKFNAAFHSTKDRKLRRNLQFLRKKYSSRILDQVLKDGPLNESYLNFLVNQYLKEIRVGVLSRFSEETVLKRMGEIGYSFEKVYFDTLSHMELDRLIPFINRFVSHLPNVEKLFFHSQCDDDTIKVISSTCENLKELYLNGLCTVSDDGVKHLKALSGTLKDLSLKYTDIDDDGIPFLLQNLPLLEVLTFHQLPNVLYRMHLPHLLYGNLGQLRRYNLTSLNLCHQLLEAVPNVDDILTICSQLCPGLKKLTTLVSSRRHLEILSLFRSLENLSIHGTRKEPALELDDFLVSSGKQLKELRIDCFTFSPRVLVENCPRLRSLRIGRNYFRTDDERKTNCHLLKMRNLALDKLNFGTSQTSEACFNIVMDASPNLENLIMKECVLENSRVSQKLSLYFPASNLHFVRFRYTDIGVALLQDLLTDCKFLKALTIDLCSNIAPPEIKRLYDLLKSLRKYVNIGYIHFENAHNVTFLSSCSSEDI